MPLLITLLSYTPSSFVVVADLVGVAASVLVHAVQIALDAILPLEILNS